MSQYLLQELAYERDSASIVRQLAHLPGLVFLDSGLDSGPCVNFDIISALPDQQIFTEHGIVHCKSATGETHQQTGDIFNALSAVLAETRVQIPDSLRSLPFTGGAIGYIGYDSIAHMGLYTWAIIVDHRKARTTLFMLAQCPDRTRKQVLTSLANKPTVLAGFQLLSPLRSNFTQQTYNDAFQRIQEYINAGDCYQVNLAQRFSGQYEGLSLTAYLHMREAIRSPFSGFINDGLHTVLSFSPERFLEVRGQRVTTQPIKGTRPRSSNADEDKALAVQLQNSNKDKAENLMIVDLLRNDLGTICATGSVQVDHLFQLQSFSNVHHLVSSISAHLEPPHTAIDLLRNCFPGGSITGAPKKRAMEIIAELEPDPRTVYCGTLGYIGFDGQMDTNIMIRSLLCNAPDIYCWGGSGIVADSLCTQEYQECHYKIDNILRGLR